MKAKSALKAGEVFGPFKIVRMIGSGGMGEVYEAVETAIDRRVALKVINEKGLESDEMVQRFLGEARALARFSHPNVVALHAFGQIGKQYYMAMEFIDGTSLDEFIKKTPYGIEETLKVFRQLCDGMQAAHNAGIIHRDLKPQNVIITKNKNVKIIDFGIAKLTNDQDGYKTATGMFLGTLNYLAPETAKGFPPTTQTDIYGLGLILYEMLTGRVPFLGKNSFETLEMIRNKPIEFPKKVELFLPDNVKRLVLKMTAKNLTERFVSVSQALEELEKISLGELPQELKIQSVRSRKVTNYDAIHKALKAGGFEDPEIKMIVNLACDIQAELDFDPNATAVVGEQEEIRLGTHALKEAAERFTFVRSDLSQRRTQATRTMAAAHTREVKCDNRLFNAALVIGIAILLGGGVFWRAILGKLTPAAAPKIASEARGPGHSDEPNVVSEPKSGRKPAHDLDDNGLDSAGNPLAAPLPKYIQGEVYEFTSRSFVNDIGTAIPLRKQRWTVTQSVGDEVVWMEDQGTYRSARRNPFVGATQVLNNVDGSDYSELKIGDTRAPFPLEVGKSATYELVGKALDERHQWRHKVTCAVKSYELKKVEAGQFWTYLVECRPENDPVSAEIFYYSPEVKVPVLQITRTRGANGAARERLIEYSASYPAK
jgi:tRNA A-37 threonylcarbamoyl transferase component Bud32